MKQILSKITRKSVYWLFFDLKRRTWTSWLPDLCGEGLFRLIRSCVYQTQAAPPPRKSRSLPTWFSHTQCLVAFKQTCGVWEQSQDSSTPSIISFHHSQLWYWYTNIAESSSESYLKRVVACSFCFLPSVNYVAHYYSRLAINARYVCEVIDESTWFSGMAEHLQCPLIT